MPKITDESRCNLLAFDTETTGFDLRHGARPFIATFFASEPIFDGDNQLWYEWDVDPLTRKVYVPAEDIQQIQQYLSDRTAKRLVGQNIKFDVHAVDSIRPLGLDEWRWEYTHDTLVAGHILASNQPHDLTSMASWYLGENIRPYEDRLEKAVKDARRYCQHHLKEWRIGSSKLPEMPSAKEKSWGADYWLPKAMIREGVFNVEDHDIDWSTVTAEYANKDSEITLRLWQALEEELHRKGLWELYVAKMQSIPAFYDMERCGITMSKVATSALEGHYTKTATRCNDECVRISKGHLEELPDGVTKKLQEVVFVHLGLKSDKKTEKGNPSMDKYVLDEWLNTLDPEQDSWKFVKNLREYRRRTTGLGYITTYRKYWRGCGPGYARLFMSLNPNGTDTTRSSCKNPNGQQISKQELEDDEGEEHTARDMFCPLPGREMWSLDYENIELRIPGYKSEEQAMIDLFERPDDPPFYGSYHLLNASIMYPDLFWPLAEKKGAFKDKYKSTWYQWCKNAGFALIYGCQAKKFDATAHKSGAYGMLRSKLPNLFKLNDSCIAFANKHGYVETLPDKTVNPYKGYPLICSRTDSGYILPTVPLNYVVQGTAGWCATKAMTRVWAYLREVSQRTGQDYRMILLVHDELVFDFPAGTGPEPWRTNLEVIRNVQRLMEQSGDDITVPLKAAVTYHAHSWGEGLAV